MYSFCPCPISFLYVCSLKITQTRFLFVPLSLPTTLCLTAAKICISLFSAKVICLLVIVMTKTILRDSKVQYHRIVLVCEVQLDWNRWILQHTKVCLSFRNMQHVDADEPFVGVMHLIYYPSADWDSEEWISWYKPWLNLQLAWTVCGFFVLVERVNVLPITYLESGRYWSCSVSCLSRAEFSHRKRQKGKSVLCPTALGRLVYCLGHEDVLSNTKHPAFISILSTTSIM